jgi:hypothetical protein
MSEIKPRFFHYRQNNSGGSFDYDDARGIGIDVWVEAMDPMQADDRAERIGLYWNGCDDGRDCPCCGDRWYPTYGKGEDEPDTAGSYPDEMVYVHRLDGNIERFKDRAIAARRGELS